MLLGYDHKATSPEVKKTDERLRRVYLFVKEGKCISPSTLSPLGKREGGGGGRWSGGGGGRSWKGRRI